MYLREINIFITNHALLDSDAVTPMQAEVSNTRPFTVYTSWHHLYFHLFREAMPRPKTCWQFLSCHSLYLP